jgi:hypothetical protein
VTSTLDFFAPLGLASGRVPGLAIGLAAAAMLWLVVRYLRPGSPADGARASVPAIIALVWTAIFVLAHDGVYPFGGRMRHQFVLFPFFAFALALVVDDALARLRRPPARALVALILAVWTTVTGVRGLRAGRIEEFSPTPTLWSVEIAPALRGWSEGDVLYTGRINAIAVFSHFKDRPWKAEKRGPGDDLFHAKRTGEPTIRVLRSDEWWLPTPIDEKTAAELAAVIAAVASPRPRDRGAFRSQADRRAAGRRARGARHPRGAGPHPRSPLRVRARRGAARVGDPEDRAMIAALGAQVFGQSALARY